MSHIEVASYNDWLIRIIHPYSTNMIAKGSIISSAILDPLQILPNSRNVDVDQYEPLEVESQYSALLTVLTFQHILSGMLRRVLGEHSNTRISG